MSKTPEYRVWKNMIVRCENPARTYYNRYGGRGIKVCTAWRESFPRFLADMGPRPSLKHSIERIHNDCDYEPINCRWATMEEQGQNTSRSRRITHDGITLSISGWARKLHRSKKTITDRFEAGMPIDG